MPELPDIDPATRKHLLALPEALRFTPGLSALHSCRTRSLDLPEGRCTRCGSATPSRQRIERVGDRRRTSPGQHKSNAPHARVVRWTCLLCQHVRDIPISSATDVRAPRVDKATRIHLAIPRPEDHQAQDPHPVTGFPPTTAATKHAPDTVMSKTAHSASLGPTALVHPQPRTLTDTVTKTKPRQKHMSGLQAMLARNRERVAHQVSAKNEQPGLGAFLSSL
jgi:hypothetical protein